MADKKDTPDNNLHIGEQLAYNWDLHNKRLEKIWTAALVPPSSLRAVADRVAAQKRAEAEDLRRRRLRGRIIP